MLFSGFIGILHQFLTNTLVRPARIPTRCVFDYGVTNGPDGWSWSPELEDKGANLVYQSQLATIKNGGTKGIYKYFLAENEVSMFRPQEQDTVGSWSCVNVKNQTVPWTGPQQVDEVSAGIPIKEYLHWVDSTSYSYPTGPSYYTYTFIANEFVYGFTGWSADSHNDLRHVRASVLNYVSFGTGHVLAIGFDCTLNFDGHVPDLAVGKILRMWRDKIYGYEKSLTTVKDSALWLELTLEAIINLCMFGDIMTASDQKPPGTIGCVVDGTTISIGIFYIFGLLILILLTLIVNTFNFFLISRRKFLKDGDLLPFDFADWQLATYRHYHGGRSGTLEELRTLVFHYDSATDVLRLETQFKNASGRPTILTSHSPQQFERLSQDVLEYEPADTGTAISKPFQFQRNQMVMTYARVSSDTSQHTLNGCTDEVQFAEDGWPLNR